MPSQSPAEVDGDEDSGNPVRPAEVDLTQAARAVFSGVEGGLLAGADPSSTVAVSRWDDIELKPVASG